MSNRKVAKAMVQSHLYTVAPDFVANCKRDGTVIKMNPEFRAACHEILEGQGYRNAGTRNCIMNEAWRELGIQKTRDSFRQKVYRFEDTCLYPTLNNYPVTLDQANLVASMVADLIFIVRPDVTFEENTRDGMPVSLARGGNQVFLHPIAANICTLIHELCHIYLQQNGDTNAGHTPKFMAIQIVLLARFCEDSFDRLLKLCLDNKAPIDKEFACHLNQVTAEL